MTVSPIEIHPGDESARKLWGAVAELANHLAPQGWCPSFQLLRPSLLGAILLKARALHVHSRPNDQREDLVLLLSFVPDPSALAGELKGNESKWLKEAENSLRLDESVGRLDEPTVRRARQALGLLTAR